MLEPTLRFSKRPAAACCSRTGRLPSLSLGAASEYDRSGQSQVSPRDGSIRRAHRTRHERATQSAGRLPGPRVQNPKARTIGFVATRPGAPPRPKPKRFPRFGSHGADARRARGPHRGCRRVRHMPPCATTLSVEAGPGGPARRRRPPSSKRTGAPAPSYPQPWSNGGPKPTAHRQPAIPGEPGSAVAARLHGPRSEAFAEATHS